MAWHLSLAARGLRRAVALLLNRQFFIFLFFLALSAAFWLFQTMEEEYEKDFFVPLRLKNVPQNVVITSEMPTALRITLKDKGSALLRYRYANRFTPITIDFAEQTDAGGHVRFLGSDFSKQIAAQLGSGTRLTAIKPDTVEFYYNYGLHKRVPVRIVGDITAHGRYHISRLKLRPDSVTLYARAAILDTITAAYTTPLFVQDVGDTLHLTAPLRNIRGAKFVPNKVDMTVFVDQMTEKTVEVPVAGVNFPASKVLRTFPPRVRITFQVGTSMYRQIGAEQFVLALKYDELTENKTGKCPLLLRTVPSGVSHVRITPSEVDFLIENVPEED